MAELSEVRTALANTIKNHAAMELFTYRTVEDMVEVPAVVIEPLNSDFTVSMRMGSDTWEFHIFVLVGRVDEGGAQDLLDQLVTGHGPNSIRQILFEHGDLGLPNTETIVYAMRGYGGNFEVAKIPHIGAVLKARVITDP